MENFLSMIRFNEEKFIDWWEENGFVMIIPFGFVDFPFLRDECFSSDIYIYIYFKFRQSIDF